VTTLERIMADAAARRREAQERLKSATTTAGHLSSASLRLYPALMKSHRGPVLLEEARSYEAAENQLQTRCLKCQGHAPEHRLCEYPTLTPVGRVTWGPCALRRQGLEAERYRRLLGESNLEGRALRRRLDNFERRSPDCAKALTAAREFVKTFPVTKGLCFIGPYGVGKTHLTQGIVRAMIDNGVAARHYTEQGLWRTLRDAVGQDRLSATVEALGRVPVLAVDDLGKEHVRTTGAHEQEAATWGTSRWFEIVDLRYEADLTLVLSTNLTEVEIGERYGPAVMSRLAEMVRFVPLAATDYRLKGGK